MRDDSLKQSTRLYILFSEVVILCFTSYFAFNRFIPPASTKGFWFYAAILSLILGSRLVTPFFHKPADVISYSTPALIALFLVNNWTTWTFNERIIFSFAVLHCSLVGIASFISILTKDSSKDSLSRLSNSLRVTVDVLGNPRLIFSILMFFSIYVFHRESAREVIWIGFVWVIIVAFSPVEIIIRLYKRLKILWLSDFPTEFLGTVVAYQNPDIILIRQTGTDRVSFGSPILVNDPHAPGIIGLTLDYIGRYEGVLLRSIKLDASLTDALKPDVLRDLPENVIVNLDKSKIKSESSKTSSILKDIDSFVGIIAPETSIERLYFEVIKEKDLEEGRLVKTFISDRPVLYQIVNGLTKEEIVHQKNTYGYARAQAQKIGIWDEPEKRFKVVKWLPTLNAPVFLMSEEDFTYDISAVGHFPKTNFSVGIKSIHELVTHNTAILGILGVGKSILAIELVERLIAEGIKVICLDLTNQYATELSDFYAPSYEGSRIAKIKKAGKRDQDNWDEDPEKGGSVPAFAAAIYEDIKEFLDTGNPRLLKIYNPAQLFATKQLNEPRSFMVDRTWYRKAPLWGITPVEVTRIISEATLSLLQDEMTDTARACLIYEEAHSLIPEWNTVAAEGDRVATSGTARAILQGRKYGLGCLLITQRTANVTKTILNQCNSIFAMRTFDETGKDFLSNYIGKDYTSVLSSILERQAVFFGKASTCENPVLIQLNDRAKFKDSFRGAHPPPELPIEEQEASESGNSDDEPTESEPL